MELIFGLLNLACFVGAIYCAWTGFEAGGAGEYAKGAYYVAVAIWLMPRSSQKE